MPTAGDLPNKGLNPCLLRFLRLLHWQADSLPLSHWGNASLLISTLVPMLSAGLSMKEHSSKEHLDLE